MFTGLVKDIGRIRNLTLNNEGMALTIESDKLVADMEIDDSVSVNGVCQTVISKTEKTFTVQAVHATLEKTTFCKFRSGDRVNLELALQANDRLGGHFVQGHVNATGKITGITPTGKNIVISIKFPPDIDKYIVQEGSITVDGISLTVYKKGQENFSISIIPHTLENTTLIERTVGDEVNLEVDIIAKYVERMLRGHLSDSKISESWLKQQGY